MKLIRFEANNKIYTGILSGEYIETEEESFPLHEVRVLTPCEPTKIVCVGLNYRSHAEELGMKIPEEPVIFLKPPSSALEHMGKIIYPEMSSRVDYEAEIAVVIGKKSRFVKKSQVDEHILGYTCFNDVTARDLQRKDGQWTRAKSFDTFAPFGPVIETEAEHESMEVELYLNNKKKQHGSSEDMIFSIPELVGFISEIMTLLPGDVIATGTPPGVGELKPGDVVEVRIPEVGRLVNYVHKL